MTAWSYDRSRRAGMRFAHWQPSSLIPEHIFCTESLSQSHRIRNSEYILEVMAVWHSSRCQSVRKNSLLAFFIFFAIVLICFKMREQLLVPLLLVTHGLAIPTMGTSSSKAQPLSLRFSPNGTFQLSVFEDLHYGEG